MKTVYLDMGVIVDSMRSRIAGLDVAINRAKELGYTFAYSPAHMEEVCNILVDHADEEIGADHLMEHTLYIKSLTDDLVFLPGTNGIETKKENPEVCLKRVIDGYDQTLLAEDFERLLQSFRDEKSFKDYFLGNIQPDETGLMYRQIRERYGINPDKIRSLPPESLFDKKNECILKAFKDMTASSWGDFENFPKYEDLKHSHNKLFTTVDFVFRFFEKIGYYSERANKYRSRMHDVSHAIYSTTADIIVTGDTNFRYKIRAAFSFLGVPTRIFDQEEFTKFITDTIN